MSEANINLVKSLYEAVARRDQAAVIALVDPMIEVRQSDLLPWGGSYQGLGGLQNFFTKLLSNVDSQLDLNQYIDAGDDVVMVGRTHGKTKAKGTPFDVTAVHVWTVRNGKIAGFHPYVDTPAMLEVLAA
ncbi:MAG TPA: nuclear transport factor 2 family protein [Candidatus Sulfotelmatobacter sp.]|nr:nuclear transport factor 2 family protein [Candidatus Sulfotelmatobacter sp.]